MIESSPRSEDKATLENDRSAVVCGYKTRLGEGIYTLSSYPVKNSKSDKRSHC